MANKKKPKKEEIEIVLFGKHKLTGWGATFTFIGLIYLVAIFLSLVLSKV